MKQEHCSQEVAVARAARTNDWTEPLAAHAPGCAVCRGVAESVLWMQALGGSADQSVALESRPLPDPALVWIRAQAAEGRSGAKNMRTVLEWVQIALMAAVPLGLAGWATWNWYLIEAVSEEFLINALPQFGAIAFALASVAPAVLTLAALALTYPLLAND